MAQGNVNDVNRHSVDDPSDGLWFLTEPNHVETLAELARVGNCDDVDVGRVYWLGKTGRSLIKMNKELREKLFEEREFNKAIKSQIEEIRNLITCEKYTKSELEAMVNIMTRNIVDHVLKTDTKPTAFESFKRFIGKFIK